MTQNAFYTLFLLRSFVAIIGFFGVVLCVQSADLPPADEMDLQRSKLAEFIQDDLEPHADRLEVVGNNAILKGNVRVLYQNFMVLCDTAIINTMSKDIEAMGNVRFFAREVLTQDMDYWRYDELTKTPDIQVEHIGMTTMPSGATKMRVRIVKMRLDWQSDHVIGNLETGTMAAKNFYCAADRKYFVRGESAERSPKGKIELKNAQVSTCPHFAVGEEHFALDAGHMVLTPNSDFEGLDENARRQAMSVRRYWIFLDDNIYLKLFDYPVFWLPMLLLPPVEDLQKYVTINVGYTKQVGFQLLFGKRFQLSNDPEIYTKPLVAYFSKRGWGVGDETVIRTDESWTQITAFGMYDREQNGYEDWQRNHHSMYERNAIHKERYLLRIENVTHITPRLDFRGRLEAISDVSFIGEYFNNRVQEEAQATFVNLDYQFERFIPSLYARPRVNTYMAENQNFPEFRIDIPRNHVIGGLYYQGQNSVNVLYNRWRDYAYQRVGNINGVLTNIETPETYNAFRWDTLHMFNYPLKAGWLNLIPRAGVRLTYYNRSSEEAVDARDLQCYKWTQNPYTSNTVFQSLIDHGFTDFGSYDDRGGQRFRILGEFGLEANTKISRSWTNVKNAFWELDGLRHVFIPYINFTSNPVANVKPDNLYFFDEVDRYGPQQYLRIGARNTLSTRRGPYYREEIREWFSMENYFDLNLYNKDNYGSMGNFGTVLAFTPFEKLKVTSKLLMMMGGNGSYGGIHKGEISGGTLKALGAFYNNIRYQLMDDLIVNFGYNFQNNYYQTPFYSMGSSFTEVLSGRIFPNQYYRTNEIRGGFEFRVPYDDLTTIGAEIAYDVQARLLRDAQLRIRRNFHCWDATLSVGRVQTRNVYGRQYNDTNISFSIGLSPDPGAPIKLEEIDIYSTPYSNSTK